MSLYGDNLFSMKGRVIDCKPNAPKDSVIGHINKRIRKVCTRRAWTDLLKLDQVTIPPVFNQGLVNLTLGSSQITGVSTNWPVADVVNTICLDQVRFPYTYQMVRPASMQKLTRGFIQPGDLLLVDMALYPTSTEVVAVVYVTPDNSMFLAKFTKPHDPNFTITQSSLSGRQFQANSQPFTVTAVIDPETIWLDNPWGSLNPGSGAAQSYTIAQIFFQIDPYAWRMKFAYDYRQGIPLDVDSYTFEEVVTSDPQFTASTNATIMVPVPQGPGGVNRWMLYPPQNSQVQIGIIYAQTWPRLVMDNDIPPAFIDPECYVAGAKADILRHKVIGRNENLDPYFDPQLALTYEAEFEQYVDTAQDHDEAQGHHLLQSYMYRIRGGFSADYFRMHVPWPTDFGWRWP